MAVFHGQNLDIVSFITQFLNIVGLQSISHRLDLLNHQLFRLSFLNSGFLSEKYLCMLKA